MSLSSVSPSSPSQPPQLSLNSAAIRIQARYRGWITRKEGSHVKIEQIASTLLANGLPSDATASGKDLLVNGINAMAANPSKYRGKSLPLPKGIKGGLFLNTLWIEMSPFGKHIDLLMVPPHQIPLGSGTFQVTFKAHKFIIPLVLNTQHKRDVTYRPSVIKRINYPVIDGDKDGMEAFVAVRDKGIKVHAALLKRFAGITEVKIPSLPRPKNPYEPLNRGPHHREDYDMEHEWYNGTLISFVKSGSIPLDLAEFPSKRKLDFSECLNAALEIAHTLKWFTRSLLAHADIKSNNILLYLQKDIVKAVLIDFDTVGPYGRFEIKGFNVEAFDEYEYWDILAKNNLITPLMDLQALLLSLLQCAFSRFVHSSTCLRQIRDCKLSWKCLSSSLRNREILNVLQANIQRFNRKEQVAITAIFHLLSEVHLKTIYVYQHLQKNHALRKLLEGSPPEKEKGLRELEKFLLTPEEIILYSQNITPIEGFSPPFLYNLKIIRSLEDIKRALAS